MGPVHLHLEGEFHDGEVGGHGDAVLEGDVCNRYLGERVESCFQLSGGLGIHSHDGEVEPAFVFGLGFGPLGLEFEVGEHEMQIAAEIGRGVLRVLGGMKIETEEGEAAFSGGVAWCTDAGSCVSVELGQGHEGEPPVVTLGLSLAIGGHDHGHGD